MLYMFFEPNQFTYFNTNYPFRKLDLGVQVSGFRLQRERTRWKNNIRKFQLASIVAIANASWKSAFIIFDLDAFCAELRQQQLTFSLFFSIFFHASLSYTKLRNKIRCLPGCDGPSENIQLFCFTLYWNGDELKYISLHHVRIVVVRGS